MYPKKPKSEFPPHISRDLLVYCPLCEARYNPFYARLIETREENHLLHSQCKNCGAYIVSLVTTTPFGLSSIGVISDLSADDVLKFKNQPKISYDDVIEYHRLVTKTQKSS